MIRMRLLIVEDEQDIAIPLKKTLENRGYAVDLAEDGKQALETSELNQYDCILLDLNLPEVDGITVAKTIRETQMTPIIMVTARSQIFHKLDGFEHGADDYVTKPFNIDELTARINAVIKRSSDNGSEKLTAGGIELLPRQNRAILRTLEGREETVELTTKETGILEYLIRNRGAVVSTEELLEHVWDNTIDLFTETVKTHIKTLRKKLDPDKEVIRTVRGKGYRVEAANL